MTVLPAELTYGKVVGRFLLAVADTVTDPDRTPDATPATGTVKITPKAAVIKTTSPPTTVIKQPIACTLDADGQLTDPTGATGVWLVTGIYTVTYAFSAATLASHDIEVLATHDDATPLDLTNAIPPGGPILSASEYAELSARIDALDTSGGGLDDAGVSALVDDPASATRLSLNSTYVGRAGSYRAFLSVPDGSTDSNALRIEQNNKGNTRAITVASYGSPDYAVKIDHYGATNGHVVDIESHTTGAQDADYTVLGVSGDNLDFGTAKFVNNAAQYGGAIVAAWGSHADRTAPIYVADNWGKGDGFQSVHRAGSSAISFRAAFDGASTYTQPVVWLPTRNTANDVILVENATPQTSGSLMYLNQKDVGSTAPNIRLGNAGSGYLIDATAKGFAVDGTGQVRTSQLFNITSFNNSKIALAATGTSIVRNIGDGGVVLQVKQDNAGGTGDLLNVQTSGSVVRSRFNKGGYFMTRNTTAPADADLVNSEVAFWLDATAGATKLMVKAKDSTGAVRTGSVALS